MAYVPSQPEEENKPATTGAAPLPTTGGGGGASPTTGGSAQPVAPQGGNQGFANLNQYLGANQGKGQEVAGSIASNLNNQYAGVQGDINNAANQATEAIKGGSTAYDPNLVSNAFANPSQFVADPNNLAAWSKQYNAAYTGPTSFESSAGYGQAANAANKANQTYQLGQSGGGYSQLLNQVEKNPTAGRTALDKSLIQSDPTSQQTVQAALNPFKSIGDYLSGKSADVNKQATEAAQTTQEAAKKTQEAATGAETSFESSLKNKLAEEQQKYQDITNQYKTALNTEFSPITPPGQISKGISGVNQDYITKLKDLQNYGKLADYEKPFISLQENGAPTQGGVANPEDYARSQALSQLIGGQSYLSPSDISQAGTYKNPTLSFDINKANKTVDPVLHAEDQKYYDMMKQNGMDKYWLNLIQQNPTSPFVQDIKRRFERLGVL